MSYQPNVSIKSADSASIDSFGRWRISYPYTLFDSKQIFDDPDLASNVENQPLFYDNQQTSGTGTSTTYSNDTASTVLSVSNLTAGTRVRQTRASFNYEPGKSFIVLRSFILGSQSSGITKRIGYFNSNNGLFLEDTGTDYAFVRRTFTSGSAVDNTVTRANWNLDKMDGTGPSGINLDFTKTQILFIDYEWLGVGRVRYGFVVDGIIYYAHEILNTNNLSVVYMSNPDLPLRTEISNDGTGPIASITDICSSVISEGGTNSLGVVRYVSTAGTHVDAAVENTIYAILGIQLRPSNLSASVVILDAALQIQTASHQIEWILKFNPTVAGTFTYNGIPQSVVQYATGATANTVTGGYDLAGGFLESGGNQGGAAGSLASGVNSALRLGSQIDGTPDSIVLCARPIGASTDVDIEGSLAWRELL
jgi:hypothetical protein